MRYRWVILITVLVGLPVALAAYYWPHLATKAIHVATVDDAKTIATRTLVVVLPDEPLSRCSIGPVSFEIPSNMAKDIAFKRGVGGMFITLRDASRRASISLPEKHSRALQDSIVGHPEKARLTFSRLHKEICEARRSDITFGMSRDELAWRNWLLAQRLLLPTELAHVEYLFRGDLDGHLVGIVSGMQTFQWDTTDLKWEGTIYFSDAKVLLAAANWMRRTSASYTIDGDPSALTGLDEQAIRELLSISDAPRNNEGSE